MKSLLDLVRDLQPLEWDYYLGIDRETKISNPFIGKRNNHPKFIKDYFIRGGKIDTLKQSGIDINEVRLPNHINSVFFMGILFYYKTSMHKRYRCGYNELGYKNFPFIWFLIALFHDNAYSMEGVDKLININSINDLKIHFNIDHFLFDQKINFRCRHLLLNRQNYFKYRKEKFGVVDHGLLGGILLYDRLIKIRRQKKQDHDNDLFWGQQLEGQYKLAANAISLHNIWMPSKDQNDIYDSYSLNNLINCKEVNFSDFPLFYILGIVDTIEPLKAFRDDNLSDEYILNNITADFKPGSVLISCKDLSKLKFEKLINKTDNFLGWLNIEVKKTKSSFELIFK